MAQPSHRRLNALALVLAATVAGLIWRLAPLHLPWFLFKYGGSVLWAIALYFFLATLLPKLSPSRLAILAALVAALLEFSRLWHTHATDAFRLTLAGRILLGRFFSLKNIAAYWLAIAVVSLLDHLLSSRTRSSALPA